MKNSTSRILSLLLGVSLLVQLVAPSVSQALALTVVDATANHFSEKELDALMGPIALYPDPLLAQVIPAATFVDQVVQANKVLKGSVNESLIQNQPWDVSVKSVAHYPQVLGMMATQPDWTTSVGQAYVYQSTEVMKSIQRLRALAKNSGALVSTPQQTVTVESSYITIVPAQPQVIYVPVYDPHVVYVSSGPSPGAVAIAFGAGLAIGAWLNRDWHWHGPGIYYHGWVGVGWIGVNRSFIHVNHYYVNSSFNRVSVNRTIVNRNVTHFRTDVNHRSVNGRHLDINRGFASTDLKRPATTPARLNSQRNMSSATRTKRSAGRTSTPNRTTTKTSTTRGSLRRR